MRLPDFMKQTRTIAGAALAVLLILPMTASRMIAQPQSDSKDEDLGAAIKVDVDVVSLYCTVHNKQNGLVGSLTKNDFDLRRMRSRRRLNTSAKKRIFR